MALSEEEWPTGSPQGGAPPPADLSIGDLVGRLSDETARLIRDEVRLARAEMGQKAKAAGVGAGMLGGAGVLVVYGVGALIAAAVVGLALVVAAWAAALIVAAALFVVAAAVAVAGKKEVGKAGPPLPTEAMHSTKQDVDEMKRGLRT